MVYIPIHSWNSFTNAFGTVVFYVILSAIFIAMYKHGRHFSYKIARIANLVLFIANIISLVLTPIDNCTPDHAGFIKLSTIILTPTILITVFGSFVWLICWIEIMVND